MRNRIDKFGLALTTIALLTVVQPAQSGELAVRRDQGTQVLQWDFSGSQKLRYDIDRFDPIFGRWNKISTRSMAHSGKDEVAGAGLYRVKACNTSEGNKLENCESSNVVWVPVFPTEDEIPAAVVGIHGEVMTVDKNLDLEQQTEQYNVYLLVKTLDSTGIDIRDLPPMLAASEQQMMEDGRLSFDEGLQLAFYLNYSAKRELAGQEHTAAGHRH